MIYFILTAADSNPRVLLSNPKTAQVCAAPKKAIVKKDVKSKMVAKK